MSVQGIISGTGSNGVMLLGEAFGEVEARHQQPFKGPAGAQLGKMLAMLGLERDDFLITNCCSFRPPKNRPPTPEECEAWRQSWECVVWAPSVVKVIVPLGNIALRTALGMENILDRRGYVYSTSTYTQPILPTVHPSYIMRGNHNWTGVWMRDVQMALQVAQQGWPSLPKREMILDSPNRSSYVARWQERGQPPVAVDIETGYDKDEDEGGQGAIYRIGFAYRHRGTTHALSIPWSVACAPLASTLLLRHCLVWNRHFDIPRLKAQGVQIGKVDDVQEMWHVFQTDLPKKLVFAAPWLVPGQSYWKDLSGEQPAFYNAVDVAITAEGAEVLHGQG